MPVDLSTFEAKIDRSGEHHLWLGSATARGSGQIRIDGKLRTAAQVAWELENGAVPADHRVQSCPDEPLCVDAILAAAVLGQQRRRRFRRFALALHIRHLDAKNRQRSTRGWTVLRNTECMEDNTVELADGQVLGFSDYGPPNGTAVLLIDRAPGSRFHSLEGELLLATASGSLLPTIRDMGCCPRRSVTGVTPIGQTSGPRPSQLNSAVGTAGAGLSGFEN